MFPEIGRQLDFGKIVEGSVRSGTRLRITVQLITAAHGCTTAMSTPLTP